jgi:hypothetical protein
VLLFTEWEYAYDSSECVWQIVKRDHGFDVNVLVARIQLSFAHFLVRAIREFISDGAAAERTATGNRL